MIYAYNARFPSISKLIITILNLISVFQHSRSVFPSRSWEFIPKSHAPNNNELGFIFINHGEERFFQKLDTVPMSLLDELSARRSASNYKTVSNPKFLCSRTVLYYGSQATVRTSDRLTSSPRVQCSDSDIPSRCSLWIDCTSWSFGRKCCKPRHSNGSPLVP